MNTNSPKKIDETSPKQPDPNRKDAGTGGQPAQPQPTEQPVQTPAPRR